MLNMVRKAGDSQWLAEELDAAARWLEAGGESFLALWQPNTSGSPKGAVLMLPAEGHTANGQGTFTQLRRQLPEHGWATLSITLPPPEVPPQVSILTAGKDTAAVEETEKQPAPEPTQSPEAVASQRIRAALAYLQQNSQGPLVILGEGIGAARAWQYLAENGQGPFQAAVLLNARNTVPGQEVVLPENLVVKTLPALDLYSGEHFLGAQEAKARRFAARTQGLQNYRQIRLGPQPEISSGPTAGSRQVRGFLRSLFEEK